MAWSGADRPGRYARRQPCRCMRICLFEADDLARSYVPPPRRRGAYRSSRSDLHLHPDARLGRRRAGLVRRRPSHSPVRHRRARGGRHLPPQSAVSRGKRASFPRCSRAACRRADRSIALRARPCPRSCDAMPLGRQWRWRPNRCLVRVAKRGRPELRHGQERLCPALGSVLAQSPLRVRRGRCEPFELGYESPLLVPAISSTSPAMGAATSIAPIASPTPRSYAPDGAPRGGFRVDKFPRSVGLCERG